MQFRILTRLTAAALLAALGACNWQPPPPRTRAQIQKDRETVDTLYITEDGQRVVAPGAEPGMVVDPKSGKLAFRAWQCNNPACPARAADGSPCLFPLPDPFAYIDEQGQPRVRQPQSPAELAQVEEYYDRKCPACLEKRDLAREPPAQRQQYQAWLELHVLPQAKRRLEQLDEEYRRYVQTEQQRTSP